jgi:hypothetical protein
MVQMTGNTIQSSFSRVQSKRWVFTYFWECESDVQNVHDLLIAGGWPFIFGREECPTSGRKHLQGYVETEFRMATSGFGLPVSTHFEKARGTRAQCVAYSAKDGVYSLAGIPDPADGQYTKIRKSTLRPEAQEIVERFEGLKPEGNRDVFYYWEAFGNWGKTLACLHMVDFMGAMYIGGGRSKDAVYAFSQCLESGFHPRIVLFDLARGEVLSTRTAEILSNGVLFCGKYESKQIRFRSPWIVCFSNERPDLDALSVDRWHVKELL